MATHAVMSSKLAKALMESGVQHFDAGGSVQAQGVSSQTQPLAGPAPAATGSAQGPAVGGTLGQLLGGTTFSASGAPIQQGTNASQLNQGYNTATQGVQGANSLAQALAPQVNPAIANQQALGTALLNQSQGIGPNPAQAALNSSTGQNVANQAALMAGQRGASANPALMAKLIAEQGARTQQQAVGQSATLQAEQQLAAQRELGGLSAQQIQQAQAAQNAGTQAGLSQEGELQAANTAGNNAAVSSQNNINDVNARISAANANQGGMLGGLINGVGAAIPGIAGLFKNGAATGAADAGAIQAASTGSLSSGMDLGAALGGASTAAPAAEAGGDLLGVGSLTDALGVAASNVAPLAVDLAPLGLSSGGKVSGKPKVKGNDPRNDTTPAMLSPGEIVLPNSVTQSPDAAKKAAEFVKHLKGKNKKEETGYSKVASAKKSLKERVEHLEKLCSGGMV